MFKIDIYKHQKYSIYFISIFCTILKIISLILTYEKINQINEENENENKSKRPRIIYKNNFLIIFIGIVFYFLIILIRAYTNCKMKWLFDFNFISKGKLIMSYGFFGIIFCSTACAISTHINCEGRYWCKVFEHRNATNFYYDNYEIYYKHIFYPNKFRKQHDSISDHLQIFFNILNILLLIITFSFKSYFFVCIIKNLTPVHAIGLTCIYEFLVQLIVGIYTLCNLSNDDDIQNLAKKLILDLITELLSIIAILIYLEIIELNFCGCDINLRKNITKRARLDSEFADDYSGSTSFYEEDEANKEGNDRFSNELSFCKINHNKSIY